MCSRTITGCQIYKLFTYCLIVFEMVGTCLWSVVLFSLELKESVKSSAPPPHSLSNQTLINASGMLKPQGHLGNAVLFKARKGEEKNQ